MKIQFKLTWWFYLGSILVILAIASAAEEEEHHHDHMSHDHMNHGTTVKPHNGTTKKHHHHQDMDHDMMPMYFNTNLPTSTVLFKGWKPKNAGRKYSSDALFTCFEKLVYLFGNNLQAFQLICPLIIF